MASGSVFVNNLLKKKGMVMFSKSTSPECKFCRQILRRLEVVTSDNLTVVEIEKRGDVIQVENHLQLLTNTSHREVPAVFCHGRYVGGYRQLLQLQQEGKLQQLVLGLLGPAPREVSPGSTCSVRARILPARSTGKEDRVCVKVERVEPAPPAPPEERSFIGSPMYQELLQPAKSGREGRRASVVVGDPDKLVGTIAELPIYARPLIEDYAYRRKPRGSVNSYSTDAKSLLLQDRMVTDEYDDDDDDDATWSRRSSRRGGRPQIKVVQDKLNQLKLSID